jgi:hypothetical protein
MQIEDSTYVVIDIVAMAINQLLPVAKEYIKENIFIVNKEQE